MTGSAQMKRLFHMFGKSLNFAGSQFMYRGLWVWTGKRNVRIIPFNRFDNPLGREDTP